MLRCARTAANAGCYPTPPDLTMRRPAPLTLAAAPDPATWDALVDEAPGATVFHTRAWGEIWVAEWPGTRWQALVMPGASAEGLASAGGFAAALPFVVRDGVLGRSVLSMPYGTYGGPIVRPGLSDAGNARRALLEGFGQVCREGPLRRAELAWYEGERADVPAALECEPATTHVRALSPDFEALLRALPLSVRSRVRQAETGRLTMRRGRGPGDVAAFHGLAERTMRRRGGKPKPRSLYERIVERMAPSGLARLDVVEYEGLIIAGSLHFTHRGVATNWLTVADETRLVLRPNHLILARVMRELCEAGFHTYNFGASPARAAGLVRFKEDWGGTRRTVLRIRIR